MEKEEELRKWKSPESNVKGRRLRRREAVEGYLFIMPAMIPFLLFVLIPIVAAIALSFTNYDMLSAPDFVGVSNYMKLFGDKRMWISLWNSVRFMVLAVFISNFLGLMLALLINRKMSKAVSYFIRLCYFLPVIVAYAYISIIWSNWLSKDTGVINYYLGLLGVEPIGWLVDPAISLYTIVLVDVWKNSGLAMIIYLAGLQNINPELYEAARLEGAHGWKLTWRITLPLLSPVLMFNLIIFMINAIQIFDPINLMTKGGPGDASRSIVLYIYDNFAQMKMGYSAAVSVVLFFILMILTLLEFKAGEKRVEY